MRHTGLSASAEPPVRASHSWDYLLYWLSAQAPDPNSCPTMGVALSFLYGCRFHVVAVILWSLLGQSQYQMLHHRIVMAWLNLLKNRLVLRSCHMSVRWFNVVNCPTASTCLAAYQLAYDDGRRCRYFVFEIPVFCFTCFMCYLKSAGSLLCFI